MIDKERESKDQVEKDVEEKKDLRQLKRPFDELVQEQGLHPAVARAVRSMVKIQSNGIVSVQEFMKAVKQFSGMQPR